MREVHSKHQLVKSRVFAQRIPIACHSKVAHGSLPVLICLVEPLQRVVCVSGMSVKAGDPNGGDIAVGSARCKDLCSLLHTLSITCPAETTTERGRRFLIVNCLKETDRFLHCLCVHMFLVIGTPKTKVGRRRIGLQ